MRRSKLNHAVLISLGLHLALGLWFSARPAPASVSLPAPVEATLTWVDVAPAPSPPPVARPEPVKRKRPLPVRPPAEAAARVAAPVSEELAPSGSAGEAAAPSTLKAEPSGPARPRLDLFPRLSLSPSGEFPVPASRGHTLRPDDPSLSPEVLALEEEHRVHERVSGWTDDTLADARAQRGLPHPYFTGVGEALKSGLDKEARAAGFGSSLAEASKAIGKRYAESMSSYAKTGNPDLGPPGITPRQSEQLKERFGNDASMVSALVQATELQNDLKHGRPLLSLTLELRQSRALGTRTVAVLEGSGEARFDAFVVDVWPRAMDHAGAPPPEAFHGPELRSVWAIEGWLGMPKKLESALSYLPVPGALGIGADTLLPKLTQDGYHYEFRARLLRVY
jgi:hypothetical protein